MKNLQKNSGVAKGSIYDVANSQNSKPEEILTDADIVVMLDISGSMADRQLNGQTRYEKAVEALDDLQRAFPGRIALVTFNDRAALELSGIPSIPSGMTNVYDALSIAKTFDGLSTKFYLISDGQPNVRSEQETIDLASTFIDPINCIFIGEDHDRMGIGFMEKLARVTKGTNAGRIDVKLLGQTIKLLVTNE